MLNTKNLFAVLASLALPYTLIGIYLIWNYAYDPEQLIEVAHLYARMAPSEVVQRMIVAQKCCWIAGGAMIAGLIINGAVAAARSGEPLQGGGASDAKRGKKSGGDAHEKQN